MSVDSAKREGTLRRYLRTTLCLMVAVLLAASTDTPSEENAPDRLDLLLAQAPTGPGPGGPNIPGVPGFPGGAIPGIPGGVIPRLDFPNQNIPNANLPGISNVPGAQIDPRNNPQLPPFTKEEQDRIDEFFRQQDARTPLSREQLEQPGRAENELTREPGREDQQGGNSNEEILDTLRSITRPPAPGTVARPPRIGTTTRERPPEVPQSQPPINSTPPLPPVFGEELDRDACCGKRGNTIFYPLTDDPQEIEKVQFATHDPRMVAHQVMPHSGGFKDSTLDITLPSVGIDGRFERTYRSDITYKAGGLIGDGWDFNWNKRIVPVVPRVGPNGLAVEIAGSDTPALYYYDGTAHADLFQGKHSERRRVINFGDTYARQKSFFAYVTTYRSPLHEFLEIERYIVENPQDHPFKEHPDVKVQLGESIFYVVRLKDGMQYIFNCRGQVIYVFDKHHNRMEFHYRGPMNPLTRSPMLSEMIDTAKRSWSVKTVALGQASMSTNFDCKLLSGTFPIPRISEITDPAGRKLVVHYQVGEPARIDWITREYPGDIGLSTRYRYTDGLLSDIILPREFGGQRPLSFVHNTYDQDGRVVTQQAGAQHYDIQYGATIGVTDATGGRVQYALEDLGDTKVVSQMTIGSAAGQSWIRRYSHNGASQITQEILPRGNRIEYIYDLQNDPVTLGRVRDWDDRKLTYESDLSLGNLLAVRRYTHRPNMRVVMRGNAAVEQFSQSNPDGGETLQYIEEAFSYEQLFNEKSVFIDKNGNLTAYEYDYNKDYGYLGVPWKIQTPAATRPDASKLAIPPQLMSYSVRGEPLTVSQGKSQVTNEYDQRGWHVRQVRQDGRTRETVFRADGAIMRTVFFEGYRIDYERNGRGLVTQSTLDPAGAAIRMRYRYDIHGNTLEMRKDVKDLFPRTGAGSFGVPPQNHGENVTTYEYDAYDRQTKETRRGFDGLTVETSTTYDPAGRILSTITPSPAGAGTITRTYTYDPLGDRLSEEMGGRRSTKEYDENGNLVRERPLLGGTGAGRRTGPQERATVYFYDGFDRQIAVLDSGGGIMRRVLDKIGNVLELSMEGQTGTGNARAVLFETKSEFDEYRHPISLRRNTFVNGVTTTESHYDENQDLVREKGPGGAFTLYEYDIMGRRTRMEDPLGNSTKYVYSASGYLTSIEESEQELTFATPRAQGTRLTRTYATTIANDLFGSPIRREMRGGQTARMGYDSEGNVRVSVDETGRATVNSYDSLKHLISVTRDGRTSRMVYNPAGMRISADLPGGAMSWTYDQFGEEIAAINRTTGGTIRKSYDGVGQMDTMTDASGKTYTYRYDTRGRMTGIDGQEQFAYDGLGRVVSTGNVTRSYDGLGNVVSERQRFTDRSRLDVTLRSEYAYDGSRRILRVPAIAGAPAATYRWQMDALGRVTRVEADGRVVAIYDYSGASRVARVFYADSSRAIFGFDGARRATSLTISSDIEGRDLWRGNGIYFGNTLIDNREFYTPDAGGSGRSQSTILTLDDQRRPVVRESRIVLRPDPSGPYTQWVTRHYSDLDETGRATKDTSATFVNDFLTSVRSQSFGFDKGRIVSTDTRIASVTNGGAATGFARREAEDILRSPKYTQNERFGYDANGNVVSDDQFAYRYDHHDRLIGADMLFDEGRSNNETTNYTYDNFGRRISIRQGPKVPAMAPYKRQDLNFIYDGDQVIAEVLVPDRGNAILLARYVRGAADGEILRMDRRENDDPLRPFKSFYLHEGLTGGYNFVTGEDFRGVKIVSRQRLLALSENVIEGTATRVPYVGRNARYDPFTELTYDESHKSYQYDYARAEILEARERLDQYLADVRKATAELTAAELKVMGVFALPAAIPMAASLPAASWYGGVASFGLDFAAQSYVGGEYNYEQGMKAFGLGLIGGNFGVAFEALPGLSSTGKLGLDLGFNTVTGTVVEVATSDTTFTDAFMRNLLFSAVGTVAGRAQAASRAERYKSHPVLGIDVAKPIKLGLRPVARLAKRALDAAGIAAARAEDRLKYKPVKNLSADEVLKLREFMLEKLRETDAGFVVAALLETGELKLSLVDFIGKRANSLGFYTPGADTIFVNYRALLEDYGTILGNASAMIDMTSTVLHEGVHYLGGGEIAAHLAQGEFLVYMQGKNSRLKYHAGAQDLIDAMADPTGARVESYVGMVYSANQIFEDVQPLHDIVVSLDGFGGLLDLRRTDVQRLLKYAPPGAMF